MIPFGDVDAVLLAADRYAVHDQPGWRVLWRGADEPETVVHENLLPVAEMPAAPVAGERLVVTLVMGEAVSFRRARP
jgi:hypothetical protein